MLLIIRLFYASVKKDMKKLYKKQKVNRILRLVVLKAL